MFGPGEEQVDPEQSTMLLRMLEINILPQERLWADIMESGQEELTASPFCS